MELTRNAKGTIGFIIAVVCGQIWSAVSPVYRPPWEPWPPIVPFMEQYAVPFMVNYYRPVLIGLAGLAILWVWEGKRAGYLIAVVLAAIATVFGASVTVFNTMTQEWIGLLTAVVAVGFQAIMMLWYSFQGYRTHRSEHSRLPTCMTRKDFNLYHRLAGESLVHKTHGRRSLAYDLVWQDTWSATIQTVL